ncbi:MAG: amidohydrolase family protein [Acidobacteria bacterium]|nr:amidohydrolase family protein [Acidobacteriota bacterium]
MIRFLKTTNLNRIIVCGLTILCPCHAAFAQPSTVNSPEATPTVVLQNVNVIPMDRDVVEIGQTVLIRGDRIALIGTAAEIAIPAGASVIDGAGGYLLPGLTDAHVHLESWAGFRPDFGDAPLYLAQGVTTVINLRGSPMFLDWKRRIQTGQLLGPTIYTAGELVIGPRGPTLRRDSGEVVVGPNATTPDDVEREVAKQAGDGVDVIKYYGGLWRPAYLRMSQAARGKGIPIVGHRPLNLGFDALLEARQPLAHVYMLTNLYFWPIFSNRGHLLAGVASLVILILIAATWWRPVTPLLSRARVLTCGVLLAALVVLLLLIDGFFLDRLQLESNTFLAVLIILAAFVGLVTTALLVLTVKIWRDSSLSMLARLRPSLAVIAGIALAITLTVFWVPVSWRATDSGVDRMARSLRDAGISVQTTLIAFEGLTSGPGKLKSWQDDPAIDYLAADIRDGWRRLPLPESPVISPRAFEFMKTVTAALHRAGVQLVAGTDALGAPLIVPGTSLHRELQLLAECGITPYEVIRTATVNPAVFLGKDQEFGTVAVGKRADLLLVEENPLQNLATLREPIGIMVRGKYLSREKLQQMLSGLRGKS